MKNLAEKIFWKYYANAVTQTYWHHIPGHRNLSLTWTNSRVHAFLSREARGLPLHVLDHMAKEGAGPSGEERGQVVLQFSVESSEARQKLVAAPGNRQGKRST